MKPKKKTTGQILYALMLKELKKLNNTITSESDQYNIGRRDMLRDLIPRLCCRCNEINRYGRWVAPIQTMCNACMKISRKEDMEFWKEQRKNKKNNRS